MVIVRKISLIAFGYSAKELNLLPFEKVPFRMPAAANSGQSPPPVTPIDDTFSIISEPFVKTYAMLRSA